MRVLEVKRATELGESYRRRIAEVFVDGFGPDLSYFSKDPGRVADALAHMLVLEVFYVAVVDGEPAAIAACTNGQQLSVRHDAKQLRKHLGLVKGTVADIVFRREFQKPWPATRSGVASVEFVATASRFRGKGVATALLSYLFALPQYHEYVLEEISDVNTPALRLYEKLGFREFKRKKVHHTWLTGINYYVSVRLVQG